MSDPSLDLDRLRRKALQLILAAICIQPVLVAAACWTYHAPLLAPFLSALAIAAGAMTAARWDRGGAVARLTVGVGLMASISILIGAFAGLKVQVDLHMYYFAALALLVATCDWKVIAAGAATVALHHIALNFLLPALIYPGGSDVFRLLLHAVILILEAGVLIWLAKTLEDMFLRVQSETEQVAANQRLAERNRQAAIQTAADASKAQQLHQRDLSQVAREDQATLSSLEHALQRLAYGDLTHRVEAPLPAKSEALRRDFHAAIEKLEHAMIAVSSSAAGISAGADDIRSESDNLSRRTEQQAAGLQESAAALDQITATVRSTSARVDHARTVVQAAKEGAASSGGVVNQAVAAINGIQTSSREIGQIIGVIDEIAFQTNLLALNAGVEAARAGDAGRGFAVVASEVRGLAQRSAEAAKEIKALVSASSRQVAAGVESVGAAGRVLDAIALQVNVLDGLVAEIATAAKEQMLSLGQVNAAINQMDQVAQRNAEMVEQTAAASEKLAGETQTLNQLLATFTCQGGDRRSTVSGSPWPKAMAG